MSRLDLTLEPKGGAARRIEVITGAVGRRRWSDEEKARAIEESLAPGVVVSQIARRHGVTPQQLFTWRRQARRLSEASAETAAGAPPFVPAIVQSDGASVRPSGGMSTETPAAPVMDIEIDGAHVWIWRGADAGVITAVIRSLKARS